VAPSGRVGPFLFPGVSSTYVSPSRVFWRSIARVSAGIGAYWLSSSIEASASPSLPRLTDFTLPTETPEIRTSDSTASWVASSNGTVTRYPSGFSGSGPPKAIHRNRASAKHESAKPIATRIRVIVGGRVSINSLRGRRSHQGSAPR
jgi:hypothetical protein